MTRRLVASIAVSLLAGASHATDDSSLIAQTAAERAREAPQSSAAGAATAPADAEEQRARETLLLSQVRLDLVLARKDLKAGRYDDAARKANDALQRLRALPENPDADELSLQAEGVLARAQRRGGVAASPAVPSAGAAGAALPAPVLQDYLDSQSRAAQRILRRYEGADTPDIDTHADAAELKQRALDGQVPDAHGYRPAREIFDVGAIDERDRQRLAYEYTLQRAYSTDEARRLLEADEARVGPEQEVAYPDDWPERVARRERFAGGQLARSGSTVDANGREWYAAVYDVRDLTYVPPDFQPSFELLSSDEVRNATDREALRQRSQIFSGYAEDLAAGIPLLRFFGGVDDYAFRGPKYSVEKQRQIMQMIEAFTQRTGEAKVTPLPPTEP